MCIKYFYNLFIVEQLQPAGSLGVYIVYQYNLLIDSAL